MHYIDADKMPGLCARGAGWREGPGYTLPYEGRAEGGTARNRGGGGDQAGLVQRLAAAIKAAVGQMKN